MVEVDPIVLVTAGCLVGGLFVAAFFMKSPSSTTTEKSLDSKSTSPSSPVKKKKASKASKKPSNNSHDSAVDESDNSEPKPKAKSTQITHSSPEPAVVSKNLSPKVEVKKASSAAAVVNVAPKKSGPTPEEIADKHAAKMIAEADKQAARLLEEEEAKKAKKAIETPEQKAARLERQKMAKAKKAEEEELTQTEVIKIQSAESKPSHSVFDAAFTTEDSSQVDGWAVVEKPKKLKKQVESVVTTGGGVTTEGTGEGVTGDATPAVPADFVSTPVTVEAKKLGVLIGPKGVTLHAIQDATGVEITTPKADRETTGPVVVTVAGPAEGVKKAIKAIKELAEKGYSKLIAGDDFNEGSIIVHSS